MTYQHPCIVFIIIIRGILVLFIYTTRLASKETFSPSNNIHREVGRAKDLSAPMYEYIILFIYLFLISHFYYEAWRPEM